MLRGARRFIAGSKIPRGRSVLVDASATESHLDPLTAAPERNRFLQTVVPVPAQAASIGAMSERTSYEPGVPSWVDLSSPDTDASATFYGGLFGWELQSAGPVEETGGYGMFTLQGQAGRRAWGRSCRRASRRCGRCTSPPTTRTPPPQRAARRAAASSSGRWT